ncbi:MAG: hypothetical protein NC081_12325 [Roseburia sp.]|nr:hypothetical protein [Roseburia sp.]
MGSFDNETYDNRNPYNSRQPAAGPKGFALAATIFGGISVISWCTGVIPISAGALGILFACLSHRKGKPYTTLELIGLSLSCLGLAIGLVYTFFALITVVIPIMTDPAAYEQWNRYYESLYGMSLDEILNSYNLTFPAG